METNLLRKKHSKDRVKYSVRYFYKETGRVKGDRLVFCVLRGKHKGEIPDSETRALLYLTSIMIELSKSKPVPFYFSVMP